MKSPREIIITPVLTEKANDLRETRNCYIFKVSINANKIEVRKAIESIFDVKVLKVNTIRQRGKMKRVGRYTGKRPDFKKAIVQLKEGHKIEQFEI
jgi:large subunit ribosomal protein L23